MTDYPSPSTLQVLKNVASYNILTFKLYFFLYFAKFLESLFIITSKNWGKNGLVIIVGMKKYIIFNEKEVKLDCKAI